MFALLTFYVFISFNKIIMNKYYKALLLITLLYVPKAASAADRTTEQKKAAAIEVLCRNADPRFSRLRGMKADIRQLYTDSLMTVMGTTRGGFAVIANDDAFPAIIGYSDSPYDEAKAAENLNYQWWMKAVAAVLADKSGKVAARNVAPGEDVDKTVAPLLTTTWAQDTPYNNYCPTDGDTHTLVGCVATAMAQVLYYNRHPLKGEGQRTIYYPYNNSDGTAYTVDFSATTYDYDHMLDDYSKDYTDEEAAAAATLSYHCGVASDMQYGTKASGTTMNACRDGLVRYFGYSNATLYERRMYDEQTWMNMIFKEISDGLPIIYAGSDFSNFGGGHCFVFDGYDASGNVHVNWGWAGSFDGYYNVAYLNPSNYTFMDNQQMVLGVDGRDQKEIDKTVNVETAGSLSSLVSDEDKYAVTSLTVTGQLNSSDLKFVREMAGRDSNDSRTRGRLKRLDMKNAEIAEGGEPYLNGMTTKTDEIPSKAFYNCYSLSYVALPENTKTIGEAAFANTMGLDSVYVPVEGERNYAYVDGVVYSKDTTRVLTTMPFVSGRLTLNHNVKEIAASGMEGCLSLKSVELPASLIAIGDRGLAGNSFLSEIKVRAKKVPTAGGYAFDGVLKNICIILVPAGYKELYDKAEQWRMFIGSSYDNIKQFGSYVTVRNLTRMYGAENPRFSYSVTGEALVGTPELACEALPESPTGRYPVTISRGTVEGEDIEFVDGYLVVSRAPLKVIADNITRPVDEANPEFTFTLDGLKNDDTASDVFTDGDKQPVFTCEATVDSPEGEYEITVSGPKNSKNYSLKYVSGTLTVSAANAIDGVSGECVTIAASDGVITVSGLSDKRVTVYNAAGTLVASSAARDEVSFSGLRPGLYIVKAGNKVRKVNL